MSAFENAKKFFHNCESAKGWEACKQYVAEGAEFSAQSEPMADLKTVKEYVDLWGAMASTTLKGTYVIDASAYDEVDKKAIIIATYTGSHVGEGGPVPPTNKTTVSEYAYILGMNEDGKIISMQKIWNASWAMRELGWM